MTSLNKVTFCY